eukprot:6033493-Amphidinium_carterae.1
MLLQAEDPSKSQELTVEELQGEHFEADVGVESHSVRPEPTARYISDAVSGLGVTESATTANWVILDCRAWAAFLRDPFPTSHKSELVTSPLEYCRSQWQAVRIKKSECRGR